MMLDAILGTITGPLGGLLAGIVAVVGALIWGRRQGRQGEAQRRAGQDARDYRETRKEIDNADLGHGATDQQRIDRLREIADRRGSSSPD